MNTAKSQYNADKPDKDAVFERTCLLLGDDGVKRLQQAKVAVLGIGGVGSFACEALARTGIGELLLIDKDTFQASNLNRQLNSAVSSLDASKVLTMKKHLEDVAPFCKVTIKEMFLDADTDLSFLSAYDYIADCIDTVSAKIALAAWAYTNSRPLISSMGTARKLNPSLITVTDIFKTENDRICKVMRHELRKRGIKKLQVAYSPEKPVEMPEKSTVVDGKYIKAPLPSMIFVPATCGLKIAHHIVSRLLDL